MTNPFRIVVLLIYGLLATLACQPVAEKSAPAVKPVILKAEVRYLADQRDLQADLRLFRGDSIPGSRPYLPPPGTVSFLGSAMQQKDIVGRNRWRSQRTVDFPDRLRFSFPIDSLQPGERSTVEFQINPPFIDSLPVQFSKSTRQRFVAGRQPLAQGESLIVFFEPVSRDLPPRRIVVAGPANSPTVTLPAAAMSDLAPGDHSVYFVKQGIIHDTLPGLRSAVTFQYHTPARPVRVVE